MPRNKAVTECPLCGAHMEPNTRIRVSVGWEGRFEKRWYDFAERRYKTSVMNGVKTKTRTVCRECGAKLAEGLGIDPPMLAEDPS